MTEATCLLQSGALYPFRVGFRPSQGEDVFLGVKPGAFSIYWGDAPYYHFDLDGRWQRALIEGIHYLKGFDGAVHALDRVRRGPNLILERRLLSYAEAADLDDKIRSMAIDLLDGSRSYLRSLPAPDGTNTLNDGQIEDLLNRIGRWDATGWFAHREKYLANYGVLPFLPPETASPIILQATLGDSTGRQFGGAPGTRFYQRSPEEFSTHVRATAKLLGRRVLQARQIFLAGSDVLRLHKDRLLELLDIARSGFPISADRLRPRARDVDVFSDVPTLEGVHTFLHEFDGPTFDADTWTAFKERHVSRVILGIESGCETVRAALGRIWTNANCAAWVDSIPDPVGVVIPVGIGGSTHEVSHVAQTVALVGSLKFKPNSLVSLVDVNDLASTPEAAVADPIGSPLSPVELEAQRADLKAKLTAALAGKKIKVTTYSAEKRWQ